ncbi:MAG: helix-turn-helix domain-containing protein [Oscillospiraceae bacterium]|nr:helix-turn-helix domain-containing protein [Oscillospiraceae bacterium]
MFNFGTHLKEIRLSKNLTQKQLAINIGAGENGVQNYELGRRKPTYDMLIVLADYFDVSIDYLVGRTDNPDINKSKNNKNKLNDLPV